MHILFWYKPALWHKYATMGRQQGTLRFSGSVGDLNFYYTKNNGWLVRQKSSLDAKRFKTDPAFARSRESSSNFTRNSQSAKRLRDPFRELWNGLSDSELCQRSVSLMNKVREHDTQSNRGEFLTMVALQDPAAQALFKGFSFNDGPSSAQLLLHPFTKDLSTGAITIQELNPAHGLVAPHIATHVGFSSSYAKIDFDKEARSCFSGEVILPLNHTPADVVLTPPYIPALDNSITLLTLKIVFYQQVNGTNYLLSDKACCALEVIDAGFTEQ